MELIAIALNKKKEKMLEQYGELYLQVLLGEDLTDIPGHNLSNSPKMKKIEDEISVIEEALEKIRIELLNEDLGQLNSICEEVSALSKSGPKKK
jgi:hypothetical protein